MLLAFDIGNTNIVVGVFREQELVGRLRLETDVHRMADEYAALLLVLLPRQGINPEAISSSVLCSVVPPLTPVFTEVCQRYFNTTPIHVGAGVRTGIRILYENPREVGPDRVADAVAAYHLYGGPTIVVDFGTATTVNAITRDGDYLGGAIAPGLGIAAESLFQRASMLARIELVRPKAAIGRTTVQSMQSGIIFGYVGLVEGLVARFQRELGERAKVVGTGGHANLIARETKVIEEVNPDLTLVGLRIIYELNTKQAG
jgi:type III pantothenate kinase